MPVELRPMGVACNLACTYCYQEPMREAGNIHAKYDVDKMLEVAEKTNQPFHLFGGEALLVPKKDLERFWARGYELYGSNGIQTNGVLIDDEHIELFKKYNVSVGVSIDGPNELNNLRKVRSKKNDDSATLEATQKIMENLQKLVRNGIQCAVIITLHKLNGTEENLPRMLKFIRWLGDLGIKSGNLHVLEVDRTMPDQEKHVLSQKENIKAFLTFAEFFDKPENQDLDWNPFRDYEKAIVTEQFNALTCYFNRCDPMNTVAVYGVEGDGGLSNCGRTNKEGIDWYKADDVYYERYLSLYHTPPELNGCKGCPYFMVCGGGCPGECIDWDFRNKTIHCSTHKALFRYYEKKAEEQGIVPWTRRPERKILEKMLLEAMEKGTRVNIDMLQKDLKVASRRVVAVRKEK